MNHYFSYNYKAHEQIYPTNNKSQPYLLTYSNIPGRWDSLSLKSSILMGSGFTKYPMSGFNLTGNFLSLQNKASFRGKRWWWKRTSSIRFAVWPGSREGISSMEISAGLSTWNFKVLQQRHKSSLSTSKIACKDFTWVN